MSSTPQHQSRKAAAPDKTPFAQPDALKHLHVLLVEDEPDVASLFLCIAVACKLAAALLMIKSLHL